MCSVHELANAPSDVSDAIVSNTNMSIILQSPNKCPACGGSFVTDTLNGWICADCGATKENPVRRNR